METPRDGDPAGRSMASTMCTGTCPAPPPSSLCLWEQGLQKRKKTGQREGWGRGPRAVRVLQGQTWNLTACGGYLSGSLGAASTQT